MKMSYNNYRHQNKKNTATNFNTEDGDFSKKETNVKSFESMKPDWRRFCSYYMAYPDRFIDLISPPNSKVKLFFYQRMLLRILMRYQNVYITMTRGSAKSFTQVLGLYLKCIFRSGGHYFIAAPTKLQAANISQENIERIWDYFPLLRNEVKKYYFNKDSTKLVFHNGSRLDVVQVAESARGGRRNGGSVEEVVDESMKKDILNSVVLPMMANDRLTSGGHGVDPNEIHKAVAYVTTSGNRQSFAFEKLMEVLKQVSSGKNSFVIGAGYELPVMHGQLDLDYVMSLKESDTFNPLAFSREYESVWTGSSDDSFVSYEDLNDCRLLKKPEYKNTDKDAMYVLAYDVARQEGSQNANSALAVLKCIPRDDGTYSKHLVNLFSFEGVHFQEQAKFLKRKVNEFKAEMLVVDINGLGSGLVDFLITEVDENPPYSVVNDDRYNAFKTSDSIPMIYALNSTTKENRASDIHALFMGIIANKGVKILCSSSLAKNEIIKTKDPIKEAEETLPYAMTDILVEEIMNLEHKQKGNSVEVKQISKRIPKDKFSAFQYALWYVHLKEKKNRQKQEENIDDYLFFMQSGF